MKMFKPDSNIDLGVKEGDGAKGENAKHAKSCPIDVPICDSSDGEGKAGGIGDYCNWFINHCNGDNRNGFGEDFDDLTYHVT